MIGTTAQRAVVLALAIAAIQTVSWGCKSDDAAPEAPKLTEEELQDPNQCAKCHPDHFREWSGSMHAYAGVDPVFIALNKRAQRETNGTLGTFCVNCHAPIAVRENLTKDGLNLDQLDPKKVGVNCFFCHSSEFQGGLSNNPLYLQHDKIMRGGFENPVPNTAHQAMYSTSHDHEDDRAAGFCGSCHDIINPKNTHIERTFVEWRGSHIALEDRNKCGFCHMPERTGLAAQAPGVLVRKVHDHSMPGVDLALTPFPETDAQKTGVKTILDTAVSAKLCVKADTATSVKIDVTLSNLKIGHFFPSGAVQDRRAWVEIDAFKGDVSVFGSGHIADNHSVAADADKQIFLLRDYHFDGDTPTHLFWNTTRVESVQLPVSSSSHDPESTRSIAHSYTFDGDLPERVEMRLKLRPIDVDLVEELVKSGDIDPSYIDRIPTHTLASTILRWIPGTDCVTQ